MSHVSNQAPSSYGPSDYAAMLRRRWGWLVFGLLVGLAAGYVANSQLSPRYVSEASVIVESTGLPTAAVAGARTSDEINLDTEAQLVQSAEVAARVAEELDSPSSPIDLVESVTITVPPNSQVLTIGYEAKTPDAAQAGAAAFSQAYLDSRTELAAADIEAEIDRLSDELSSASESLEDVLDQLSEQTEFSAEQPFAEAQRTILIDRISSLNQSIAELSRLDERPGRIITAASLPTEPAGLSSRLVAVSALGLGFLLGVGLMVMRERTDRRLMSAGDATRDTDLRVLGIVPPTTSWGATADINRAAYERLRNVVVSITGRHRVILMTGTAAGVPIETVTTSLAAHLAATGRRVVVIDPTSTSRSSRPGLSDVLADGDWTVVDLPKTDQDWARPANYLRVDAGSQSDLLHHLLAGASAQAAFAELRRLVDVVLIVGPTDDAVSQTIATLSDGVVHVAVSRRSRRADLVASVQQMAQVDARSVGVVIVDYPARAIALARAARQRFRAHRRNTRSTASAQNTPDSVAPAHDEFEDMTEELDRISR